MNISEFITIFSFLFYIFENAYDKKFLTMESIICISMYIIALCVIVKRWKQPMCPNTMGKQNVVYTSNGILFGFK